MGMHIALQVILCLLRIHPLAKQKKWWNSGEYLLWVVNKYHQNGWHLLEMVQGAYLYSLANIGSVTAEIFLIWTNVPRTNVAWTNVNLIVGIFSRCSQEGTFQISSKLGQ